MSTVFKTVSFGRSDTSPWFQQLPTPHSLPVMPHLNKSEGPACAGGAFTLEELLHGTSGQPAYEVALQTEEHCKWDEHADE